MVTEGDRLDDTVAHEDPEKEGVWLCKELNEPDREGVGVVLVVSVGERVKDREVVGDPDKDTEPQNDDDWVRVTEVQTVAEAHHKLDADAVVVGQRVAEREELEQGVGVDEGQLLDDGVTLKVFVKEGDEEGDSVVVLEYVGVPVTDKDLVRDALAVGEEDRQRVGESVSD